MSIFWVTEECAILDRWWNYQVFHVPLCSVFEIKVRCGVHTVIRKIIFANSSSCSLYIYTKKMFLQQSSVQYLNYGAGSNLSCTIAFNFRKNVRCGVLTLNSIFIFDNLSRAVVYIYIIEIFVGVNRVTIYIWTLVKCSIPMHATAYVDAFFIQIPAL